MRLSKLRQKLVELEQQIDTGAVGFREIPGKLNQIGAHLSDISHKYPDVEELKRFRGFRTALDYEGLARRLGFQRTNYRSHGQPVYFDSKRYITPDVDSHNGGVWKWLIRCAIWEPGRLAWAPMTPT